MIPFKENRVLYIALVIIVYLSRLLLLLYFIVLVLRKIFSVSIYVSACIMYDFLLQLEVMETKCHVRNLEYMSRAVIVGELT